jgi:hypothetical protein
MYTVEREMKENRKEAPCTSNFLPVEEESLDIIFLK